MTPEDPPEVVEGKVAGEGAPDEDEPRWYHGVIGVALVGGALFGAFLFFRWFEPDDVPQQTNPDFVDTIFANGVVIAAARIVLLSAAVVLLFGAMYVAVSVIVRMQRGQWLRRAGPFESHIEEAQEELDEVDPILEVAGELAEENATLAARLEERSTELANALKRLEEFERPE